MKELEIAAQEELIHSYSSSTVIISTYGEPAKIEKCKPFFFGQEAMLNMFRKGAKWQSEQSPWVNVKERLPDENEIVLCRMVSNEAIVSGYIFVSPDNYVCVSTLPDFEFEDYGGYVCDMWMPIPKFNV